MAGPVKTITIATLDEKINELKIVKECILQVLGEESTNTKEQILRKYIEVQNGAVVADCINLEGFRIKTDALKNKTGERKYISNDITNLINQNESQSNVQRLAKMLYNFNKGKITWGSVVKKCKEIIG